MTTGERLPNADGEIRETYEVHTDGERTVATIADPENGHAWIRSDRIQSIAP
ncbi:hypothetical protein SAMN05216559_3943 [Halomicrobium zhouii]|uniref:Uncharacterized protein n=1 Tax=Halomicrobium zhouii TaxID=767519 RepID=A0A1I6M828_9EURY|nr:hypothetical protein [Halomicrobium zhouii]SFS11783.1 hypothetical protein SAMN05216559_3943 [Halomicrobium zhouii]